ncbi:MAG: zinc-binding alcohol dehydrogenase [Clostridia bacterium]|nr:zinc-binding alcohol dehydrogenase [Clostridia bacterium]
MHNKTIVFTKLNTAEFLDTPLPDVTGRLVKVRTAISTVSCGTEKANITGSQNTGVFQNGQPVFPRILGYSSAGIVEEIGEEVKSVKPGDRAIVYWGLHKQFNIVDESCVVKIGDDASFEEAALAFIATFPMAAIRKTRLELGEPMLVMGLGLLGQLAVRLARAAGAMPIVAADPVDLRREEALAGGADYAFDPTAPDFAEKVKAVTGGGAAAAIEVTGVGAGLDGALDCMAKFGRIALLGCTRDPNFTIDYYRKVHCPGITLIGAHTNARPTSESYPGYHTHRDDIRDVLKLCAGGRLDLVSMIRETHRPDDCGEVYTRLIDDPAFPIVVQFDWRNIQ